jgi:hypothetical protein
MKLEVKQKNDKFVVCRDGEPILLPKTDGHVIVTEFTTKQDAERYISILKSLKKDKRYE